MAGEPSNQLLGDYLIDAGILNLDELREAANIARTQNLPIGKVLVMSGYLTKEFLQITVELQARVKDGLMQYKIAVQALDLIVQENISLSESLARLEQTGTDVDSKNRLGEFLSAACIVSDTDLKTAIEESGRCGLPLGRVLVNLDMISEPVLKNVLYMQSQVRSGKISKENAVKALVASKGKHVEIIVPEDNVAKDRPAVDSASLPADGMQKRRRSLTKNRLTGQFPNLPTISLHQMLRAAGLVDTPSLEKAIQDSLEDAQIMITILRRANLLEEHVIEAAQQCCQLITKLQLKPEQAIIALHHCQRTRCSLTDCLLELGWLQSQEKVNT